MTTSRTRALIEDEDGFSLIELMVVMLVIAILLAVAIPTFLGTRGRAQNRAAESILRNALTAERTVYTDFQAYTATPANLSAAEPSLSWITSGTPSAASNQTYVATADTNNEVCLYTQSAAGSMYGILDVANPDTTFTTAGVWYFKNTAGTAPVCTGAATDLTTGQPASSSISTNSGSSGAGW